MNKIGLFPWLQGSSTYDESPKEMTTPDLPATPSPFSPVPGIPL
jgi:hypothetical protein